MKISENLDRSGVLKILVMGLGETGFSCVKYLRSQNLSVVVADTREAPPKLAECRAAFPDMSIYLGTFPEALLLDVTELVVSPGLPLDLPLIKKARESHIPVIGDIELFARAAKAPIIAITGSNGKSTLTTLMGDLIQHAGKKAIVCGNIGVPVLDCLALPVPDYYVTEISSFQLDTTHSLKAAVAVITNISADHMDRYPTLQDYIHSKQRIYRHCEQAVINLDEPFCWEKLVFKNPPIGFTLEKPVENAFGLHAGYLMRGTQTLIAVKELFLQQRHNNQNYCAALAIGSILQLPMENMLETLRHFEGLPHRCQRVKSDDGVIWYNDSKGTNIGASVAAIESVARDAAGKLIVLLGGDSKGADLTEMRPVIKQHVAHVILLGRDAPLFEKALAGCVSMTVVTTVKEAVAFAKTIVQKNDIVLLSPACASLDQYKNYAERGKDFMACVTSKN